MNIGRGLGYGGGVSHTHPLALLSRQPWQAIKALITLHKETSAEGLPWWSSGKDSVLPMQGGPGSIPGQGTRSHMRAATKSSHATTKTRHSQNQSINNKYLKIN